MKKMKHGKYSFGDISWGVSLNNATMTVKVKSCDNYDCSDNPLWNSECEILNNSGVKIEGIGTAILTIHGTDGELIAHREVAVTVDGIVDNVDNATGSPPADGIDDDLSGSVVSGTWREI